MFFSALHSTAAAAAAAAAALQTIKICIIERALEYFTLPFRIRLHTWLACTLCCFVCYRYPRLAVRSMRSLYLCWSNVCAHNSYNDHQCFGVVVAAAAAAAADAAVDSFFNEICMAFCIQCCGATSTRL